MRPDRNPAAVFRFFGRNFPTTLIFQQREFLRQYFQQQQRSKLRYFGVVSLRQCSSYASVRIQRLLHLLHLYKLLYNERSFTGLLRNIYGRWYRQLLRPGLHAILFGGGGVGGGSLLLSATVFSFADNGINDDEIFRAMELMVENEEESGKPTPQSLAVSATKKSTTTPATTTPVVLENSKIQNWEPLITKDHFRLQRRPLLSHPYLYEYRCSGSYDDITPMAFFIAQMDLEYRKQWDRLVVSLDVIEAEKKTGSEVVRWVTHFPYPMYPREYVYVRRACVDTGRGTFILSSKSVEHPNCPRDEAKMVRVDSYYSCMVIKAHGRSDENGFDYVLTYFDDPKAPFPQLAYNWMVNTGVLGFLDKVHDAAKALIAKRSSSSTAASLPHQSPSADQSITTNNWQRLILERYNYSF